MRALKRSEKYLTNSARNGEFVSSILEFCLPNASSNLLYAKEDRQLDCLKYVCKTCHYDEVAEPTCTERREYGATATATAGTTTDVANDPTVGTPSDDVPFCYMCGAELICNNCGENALGDLEAIDEDELAEDPSISRSDALDVSSG